MTSSPADAASAVVTGTVRRWLGAVELLGLARDAALRGAASDRLVAVILVDASSEALLGAIAGSAGDQPDERFPRLLDQAVATLRAASVSIPSGLGGALRRAHEARNGAVHHGLEPSSETVAIAVDAVTRLIGTLPGLSSVFPGVGEVGLLGAVAAVIEEGASDVAAELRTAETEFAVGNYFLAADAGARALKRTVERMRPRIGRGWSHLRRRHDDSLRDAMQDVGQRIDRAEAWLVPFALGITPLQHDILLDDLGEAINYADGITRVHRYGVEPTSRDVRAALELISQVVFHAWETGALVPGDWETLTRENRPVRRRVPGVSPGVSREADDAAEAVETEPQRPNS